MLRRRSGTRHFGHCNTVTVIRQSFGLDPTAYLRDRVSVVHVDIVLLELVPGVAGQRC